MSENNHKKLKSDYIYEYEKILLGERKIFPTNIFHNSVEEYSRESLDDLSKVQTKNDNKIVKSIVKNTPQNQTIALIIMRYAFEDILKFSPDDVYHNVNRELLKKMHLLTLMDYLIYPCGLDKEIDYFYIACLLYPKLFHPSEKELTILVYKRIVKQNNIKLPKGFFNGHNGEERALYCLRYAINEHLKFKDIEEYYKFFSSSKGNQFLREHRLMSACELNFINGLEFAHKALHNSQKNTAEYLYRQFIIHFS